MTALLVLFGSAPASAATPISPASAVEMTLVPGTGRVAIALGDAGVVIGRTDGTVVGPVSNVTGVWSVHGSNDGYIYAAQPEQHRLLKINPSTRTVVKRWSLSTSLCPRSVARTGRYLVFGYGCYGFDAYSMAAGVGVLDTETGALNTKSLNLITPIVDAVPGLPGRAVVTDQGSYSTSLSILDVSSGRPTVVASRYFQVAKFWDLQISPDGTKVALADMEGSALRVYRTSDAARVLVRSVPPSPRAVSWRGNGSVVVGVADVDDEDVGAVVNISTGAVAPIISWAAGRERFVGQRCLVTVNSSRALVASTAWWERDSQLESYGLRSSKTTLTGPSSATVGAPATFTAQVLLQGGIAPPAGSSVTVKRRLEYSEHSVTVGTFALNEQGKVQFTDAPTDPNRTIWTAEYAGNATHVASRASVLLPVEEAPANLDVTFRTVEVRGKRVTGDLLVKLSPVIEERIVDIERTDGYNRSNAQYTLDSTGHLTLGVTVDRPTEFIVRFIGGPKQHDAQDSVVVGG